MGDEIEFLPEQHDGEDLGVPEPPARTPWPAWLSWTARGVASALAVTTLAWWIASRPAGVAPSGAPAPVATVRPPTPAPTTAAGPSGDTFTMCSTEVSDLADLVAAIRGQLPGVRLDGGSALSCGLGAGQTRQVLFESISGSYQGIEVDVELTSRASGSAFLGPTPPFHGGSAKPLLASVQTQSAGVNVSVGAYGRPNTTFDYMRLQDMADYLCLHLVL